MLCLINAFALVTSSLSRFCAFVTSSPCDDCDEFTFVTSSPGDEFTCNPQVAGVLFTKTS